MPRPRLTPEQREASILKRKAYMKAYQQTPQWKAYLKAYRQTPKWKAYQKAYQKAYYLKNRVS